MCLDCGCGQPNETHGDERHITMHQLEAAAEASGVSPMQAAQNIVEGMRQAGGERAMDMRSQTGQHAGENQAP